MLVSGRVPFLAQTEHALPLKIVGRGKSVSHRIRQQDNQFSALKTVPCFTRLQPLLVASGSICSWMQLPSVHARSDPLDGYHSPLP
ncbi:hypothetical protein KIN20_017971, partial [Parelaphostrongylus tenuis]